MTDESTIAAPAVVKAKRKSPKAKPKMKLRPGKPAPDLIPPERNDSGAKVVVGCKVPMGLLLRLFKEIEFDEQVVGGGTRVKKRFDPIAKAEVLLNGPSHPFGVMPSYRIVAGYAITENVSKDFYTEWLKQGNRESALVQNRVIIAANTVDDLIAAAKDHATVLSGMQPLDMATIQRGGKMVPVDLRVPRGQPNIPNGVEPLDKVA